MSQRAKISCLCGVLLFLVKASVAVSGVKTIGTEQIRPGMKGYGLTVFEGTEPQRFAVEVVSVVPNFLLRQDIILIRCQHPVTDQAGVIGGMSGSPIYFGDRLAGALAYGWKFAKEPLAGVTPIRNMLEVLRRKLRGRAGGSVSARTGGAGATLGTPLLGPSRRARPQAFFSAFGQADEEQFGPARTPMTLGGFLEPARALLDEALAPFGLDMVSGGGAGAIDGPSKFVPGGALGVQLVRGDMSATAIGTVTAVRGKNVLAFGHPMFNMGEGYLPVTSAKIHTVIASLLRSNKLGSPAQVLGSLIQDRQAAIVARLDRQAPMIPLKIRLVDERGRRDYDYQTEIAAHRMLTPRLLTAVLVNVIVNGASDLADVTAELTGKIKISGRPPITLYDSGISRTGLKPLAHYFRPVAVVRGVLDNPFEEASVEWMHFDINLRYGLEVATVVGVYLTAEQPEPGEVVNLHVRLLRFDDEEQLLTVPVRIPDSAAGKKISLEVGGGDFISPVMPQPQDLDDLIANVSRFFPPRSLVVGIGAPEEGLTLKGRLIERLPASAVSALCPATGKEQITPYRTMLRKVIPTPFLVKGKETVLVQVADRRRR